MLIKLILLSFYSIKEIDTERLNYLPKVTDRIIKKKRRRKEQCPGESEYCHFILGRLILM